MGVAILARDSTRLALLRTLVLKAGHTLVVPADADVLLVDDEDITADKPTLVLGGRDPGQAGWLPISANAQQIDAALRAIATGLRVRATHEPKKGGFEELPEHGAHSLLTPRELDVLAAISAGFSNKAIARQLEISLHTVKFHIESLLRKLGARTRAEAVAKALEHRIRDTVDF
jgi:DNA-binding NarL/FixJ family response regulator